MTQTAIRLTASQRAFLKSEPVPAGEANKLRLAIELAGSNQFAFSRATGIAPTQLSRYSSGRDLLLSTAFLIASVFGVDVCDLWPHPPAAKASRVSRARAAARKRINAKNGNGAKGSMAA